MSCLKDNDGTVVAAHSNQQRDNKGTGTKAHDYRVASLCQRCHENLDQGMHLDKQSRIDVWELAHRRTVGWLFDSGSITVDIGRLKP
jgi:hypothetical protein